MLLHEVFFLSIKRQSPLAKDYYILLRFLALSNDFITDFTNQVNLTLSNIFNKIVLWRVRKVK